ncbi:MAG: ATP-dependent RNA helicase RhlB [Spirochaetes bacterium ADurb.Bin215]|nr:MAG: ATP-dependent RNA helicase RhlB [Spirochaetes bacterium ADurb.Bin215]
MVPTRELAVQVEEEARIVGSGVSLKSASFYGGVGYGRQQELLKKGVDIIIGTPGRVIDLQESGTMDLSQVAFLVIDEADRMFDMGFYPDLRKLIKVLPKADQRQTMLFSATLNSWVKNLAWEYTVNAKEITIEAENVTVDEIDQLLYHIPSNEKMQLLLGLIRNNNPESLIIFCNTKKMSEIVAKRLKINGYESDFIIGDLPQSKRLQVIESFKSGSLKCLVATDVAARGIDVDSLAMVINFDLPNEAENYVHRIGRTARAGKTGKAYSLCSEQDVYNLPAIEKYIENKIPSAVAAPDDLAEDKSAGVYIRTDRYDSDYDDFDSDRGRSGGRRDSRSGGRGRPDTRRGPSAGRRNSSDGRRDSRDGGRGRPDTRRGPSGDARRDNLHAPSGSGPGRPPAGDRPQGGRNRFPDRGRDESRSAAGANEQDISKLSFEERMAYYKSKYGKGQNPASPGQKSASGQKRKDHDPRDTRPAGKGGQKPRGNRNEAVKTPTEPKKQVVGGVGIKSVIKRLFSKK